mgnify:CR=1 FL=1
MIYFKNIRLQFVVKENDLERQKCEQRSKTIQNEEISNDKESKWSLKKTENVHFYNNIILYVIFCVKL